MAVDQVEPRTDAGDQQQESADSNVESASITALDEVNAEREQDNLESSDKDSKDTASEHLPEVQLGRVDETESGAKVEYDENDRPTKFTDKNGKTREFGYDENGDLNRIKDPNGREWNRTSEIDEEGFATWKSKDGKKARTKESVEVDKESREVTYSFQNKNGEKISHKSDGTRKKDSPDTDPQDLEKIFNKNFKRMDKDGDGFVSKEEIDKAFQDSSYKGEDAQMIHALRENYTALMGQSNDEVGWENNGITKADMKQFHKNTVAAQGESSAVGDASYYGGKNFDTIDKNGNGYLTKAEIQKALDNGSISRYDRDGVQKMLDRYDKIVGFSDDETLSESQITKADLEAFGKKGDESPEWKLQNRINNDMGDVEEMAEKSSDRLFGEGDDPMANITPDAIKQGDVGNCTFHAALSSLAANNPQAIKDMIKDNKDGTYTVTFPGLPDKPITVNAPSQAERTKYAKGSEHGTWPQIMEKAYGEYRNSRNWTDTTVKTEAGGGNLHTGMDGASILSSGSADTDTLALTSYATQRQKLEKAFENGKPVTANISPEGNLLMLLYDGKTDNGLETGHAYGVTGYNPETQEITIRNPHGSGGIKEGYEGHDDDDDGEFTMSLEEFNNWFTSLRYGQ